MVTRVTVFSLTPQIMEMTITNAGLVMQTDNHDLAADDFRNKLVCVHACGEKE